MMDLLKYLNARLGEASTLAGITGLLALLHVHLDPGVVKDITLYAPLVTGVGDVPISVEIGRSSAAGLDVILRRSAVQELV